MSTKPQQSNVEYEEFLRGVDLMYVALRKCAAAVDEKRLRKAFAGEQGPVRTLHDDYKLTDFGPAYFEGTGVFSIRLLETEKTDSAVVVDCEFVAHLHAVEPIHKPFVERFVKSELQLILIPFARQFVSSITASMHIPPLTLPLSRRFHAMDKRINRTAKKKD